MATPLPYSKQAITWQMKVLDSKRNKISYFVYVFRLNLPINDIQWDKQNLCVSINTSSHFWYDGFRPLHLKSQKNHEI